MMEQMDVECGPKWGPERRMGRSGRRRMEGRTAWRKCSKSLEGFQQACVPIQGEHGHEQLHNQVVIFF